MLSRACLRNDYIIFRLGSSCGGLVFSLTSLQRMNQFEGIISILLPALYLKYSPLSLSVAPGHYGQLLNVWERPRGTYPVSMAMLDLLLGMSRQGGGSLSTNEMLACVVYVMKEMLSTSHSWRYRQPTSRDEIGGWR